MIRQDNTTQEKKVFVGVSGGVDSSVALALLQEQGYDVIGVFLKVWSPDFLPCTWRDERRSAMRVCATLGVPFMTLDCEREYKEAVVDYMIAEYTAGRTPNPDVFCNKYVKFGVFLKKALEMGADYVATGHYAQVEGGSLNIESRMEDIQNSRFKLLESIDADKDQSYFVHQLGQEQLAHILFPIGHLQKSDVRKLATRFGLPTAEKKDSQGLCFIGKVDMKEFLKHYITTQPGDVLDEAGQVIGRHDGAVLYTIGERHGFEVSTKTDHDSRLFVVSKDVVNNTITVGSKAEDRVSDTTFTIKQSTMNWVAGIEPDFTQTFDVRFRYRQEKQRCAISQMGDVYTIVSEHPQFGVASGQSAVIYDGEACLGGGIIC